MTSIILMQKLLTTKLDNAEFDKMKLQQANINRQTAKVIKSLREILANQVSNKTCRLCLRSNGKRIFGGNQDFDIAFNIKHIFGVEITEDDGKPQHICNDCERTVQQAVRLKQTAETTQWRLQQELDMVAGAASDWSDGAEQDGGCFKPGGAQVAREWICRKSRTSFHTQQEFSEHEKLPSCRSQANSYVCETCGMELKSLSRLKRHRCGHCAATFASASNLASHRRRHLPPRFHCELCRRGFKFKVALENHMASQHSNAKPYNCNICAKTFSTRKMILRHELKAHNRPKMRSGILPSYMRLQDDSTVPC